MMCVCLQEEEADVEQLYIATYTSRICDARVYLCLEEWVAQKGTNTTEQATFQALADFYCQADTVAMERIGFEYDQVQASMF